MQWQTKILRIQGEGRGKLLIAWNNWFSVGFRMGEAVYIEALKRVREMRGRKSQ
jgi:hypothetical protein